MPAHNLKAWIDGRRERLRWIDFTAYAHRVFAAGNDRWLVDPHVHAGGLGQAQGVIGTEVLSIDVLAPYFAALVPNSEAPAAAAQAMFEQSAPSVFIGEVLDALAHSLGGKVDLVVRIPSPADVLRAAGLVGEATFDDLDDTAIALANVLRAYAERPLSGILVTASADLADDEVEALETVVSAARHYGWCVAISFDNATQPAVDGPPIGADVALYPGCDFAALAGIRDAGGGLAPAFWAGGIAPPDQGRVLAYGIIPADAQPETVVRCAAGLKQA
jgi:hypothetical protein